MKAVILHSGGLDSTVCLLRALEAGRECTSLGFDYGQLHRIELEYAAQQCRAHGIPRRVIRLDWDKPQIDIAEGRTPEEMRSGVAPTFLPARNAVFLALACAEAAGIGAGEVHIGVNALDYSGYPDCRPEFISAFRAMINAAIPGAPEVVAPLVEMTKPQIAAEAKRLGLSPGDTWSCYKPEFTRRGVEPCGKCDACILHEHAWREAGG